MTTDSEKQVAEVIKSCQRKNIVGKGVRVQPPQENTTGAGEGLQAQVRQAEAFLASLPEAVRALCHFEGAHDDRRMNKTEALNAARVEEIREDPRYILLSNQREWLAANLLRQDAAKRFAVNTIDSLLQELTTYQEQEILHRDAMAQATARIKELEGETKPAEPISDEEIQRISQPRTKTNE